MAETAIQKSDQHDQQGLGLNQLETTGRKVNCRAIQSVYKKNGIDNNNELRDEFYLDIEKDENETKIGESCLLDVTYIVPKCPSLYVLSSALHHRTYS